ncbi:MAG TPA: ornithine carbamoyltransferase [Verrucomicrobiae bacterium]|nr:ornithine carbamoyltransferase [Verrucomicrobiae bacterium]
MPARTYESAAVAATADSSLVHRDLVSIEDFSPEEIMVLFELAHVMKDRPANFRAALAGKQIVLFFEKASLRTRLTFETGMAGLGGTSVFVDQTQAPLGQREPLSDIAHNIERWVDAVVLRTFDHQTIVEMAQHSSIPVINALSDLEHPCQALADFFTLHEKFGDLREVHLAYIGDGNNMAHSLMLAAASVGSKIIVASPRSHAPRKEITSAALAIAARTGAEIIITDDPIAAVKGADAVYTDVWASMGQEAETEKRAKIFASYQVNEALFAHAGPEAIFMHCLPAHRGMEVAAEVIDSPRSVIFDQAENRMHVQKAILLSLLGGVVRRKPSRSNHA